MVVCLLSYSLALITLQLGPVLFHLRLSICNSWPQHVRSTCVICRQFRKHRQNAEAQKRSYCMIFSFFDLCRFRTRRRKAEVSVTIYSTWTIQHSQSKLSMPWYTCNTDDGRTALRANDFFPGWSLQGNK